MMETFDRQNRSLKLCQLISEREIDKEVDYEIRKLLIEGVDISIQDLNRNNNTPLHLATQKSDKKFLRLLLKYKPNLQITNRSGETPFDVAQNDEVRELLSSATFDVVQKKFVHEIEFQNLSVERLECLETDPAFKVLKITSCPNIQLVWEKLNQDDFTNTINNSTHLFVIAIETQAEEVEESLTTHIDIKRPIIMQITSDVSKATKMYHKAENTKQLIEIKMNSSAKEAFFNDVIHSEAFYDVLLLVQALNSNIFGTFSGSLLDVKLINDENRSGLVNYFAEANALCHRVFKLFDENLTMEELSARVNQTLKCPGDQSLLALLDLPFEFKAKIELNDDQKKILSFVDSRNYNLIMQAIECNNSDALKTLLRFPTDLSHAGDEIFWASDLCWDKQNFECLAELLEAGSPYPFNFDASLPLFATSTATVKIKSTMEASTACHESIERGDIEAVKLFIKSNPKLKQVYDSTNKSALTVALECGKTNIYSLLLSERFTSGVDDEYDEVLKNCNFKYEIMKENRKYFKNTFDEPHLKRLLNKYKLSFSSTNREACSQIIQKMFLKLNEIPEMVPILQIVSCSERLNIVFDFDCNSIQEMDPTAGSSAKGVVYPIGGFIYVGAENHREDFFKVIGTLAHELTHYAMKLTYENSCKPYANNDKVTRGNFESIVNETRLSVICSFAPGAPSNDSIINTVFTCYKQEVWHQELIVRVPHLMANYKNAEETLDEARRKNYRLFDFFLSKVLPDVKVQTKVLMNERDIRKINSLTGTIDKITVHEVQFEELSAVELEDQIIGSNAPQLTLGMLRQSLGESSHVFISIEQIAFGNIRERIGKLDKKDFAIVVDCSGMVQKHAETICKIRKLFRSGKILLVMAAEETSIVTPKLVNFSLAPIDHVWSNLTDDSQDVLMQKMNVTFQGTLCSLKNLIKKSSAALLVLPLNEFCNSENFKVGDRLADPFHIFYLPRSFITRIAKNTNKGDQLGNDLDFRTTHSRPQIEKRIFKSARENVEGIAEPEQFETFEKTLREILVESKEKTVVIISDSAGTGKTFTLHEIAHRLRGNDPTRWTLLSDLKKHIEMFKTIQGEDFKSFQGFVTQIILAAKSIFEQQLFTQFYEEGRTNILLDGFDEISPHYKEEILKALKLFTPKSGNQLWITTRSHLEMELEKTLNQLSCSLQPLTREAQIEILENIWTTNSNSKGSDSHENLSIVADGLIKKLSSIGDSKSSFIGWPILISMVAGIFDDPEKRNSIQLEKLSFYSIFKQFVEKNIDESSEKGAIARAERNDILKQSEGIMEVHRRIAIAHIFENKMADVDVDYDDEEWPVEKLTRLGLIRYDESKKSISFVHETFAEYFLADFIVGNLRTKARARGAVEILVKVLTEKDFQVVRLFLDQALKELNFKDGKKVYETVGKQLNVLREEAIGVLLLISEESCEEVVKFMLHTIEHVEEPIRLINEKEKDGNRNNVLHINIMYSSKTMIQALFDFITQNTKLEIAKITVQTLNNYKQNVFHLATFNKNEEIFSTLHEFTVKFFDKHEIKKMLRAKDEDERSVLHYAAAYGNESTLNDLFGILKELLTNEEMKEMIFEVDTDDDNSLHVAAGLNNKIALNCFFLNLNQILDDVETKKLIQQKGFERQNVFHSACYNKNEEIFSTLHDCAGNFFDKHVIKKMLEEKDVNELSVLHYAARFGNESTLNDHFGIMKELLTNEEMKGMCLEVDKDGHNSLHGAARLNNKIALNCFFKHVNEILDDVETKKLIQQKGFEESNIFHSACRNQNEEIFSTLHECTVKFFEKHEIKKMLRAKDEDELSVLHCAAAFGNESTLNDLFGIMKELLRDEEIKEMFFEVNKDGNNSLHVAAGLNNKIALKCFFKHLNENLDYDETKNLIQQKGPLQRNIFHSACYNKNKEIFSTLHECTVKFFDKHVIKKMLEEKDEDERSNLHYAAAFGNESTLNDHFGIMKELLRDEEIKEIFFEVNKDGNNSLHVAAGYTNEIVLNCFFKHLNQILNYDETKKLIQQKGPLQRNVFHSACGNENEEIFPTLHEFTVKYFDKLEIKKMLEEKDEDERSILHYAAGFGNESTLNDQFGIMKELLRDEKIKEIFFGVDKYGNNSLHVAAGYTNKIVLNCFFKHLNEILNHDETKKLIQQKGPLQRNVFHSACGNENEEIFPTLHEFTVKFFDKHEIKKMLRAKDKDEWSVLHCAAEFGNKEALNDLMKILESYFSIKELRQMKNN